MLTNIYILFNLIIILILRLIDPDNNPNRRRRKRKKRKLYNDYSWAGKLSRYLEAKVEAKRLAKRQKNHIAYKTSDNITNNPSSMKDFYSPNKEVGRQGEQKATSIISGDCRPSDRVYTNISIVYDGYIAEFDNIIVNKYGVFIIEVKNYVGQLVGDVEAKEWIKYKETKGGNIYQKNVKNPIKQVKRQTYVLSKFLKYYGINVWVDGYVLMLNNNSPVDSPIIIKEAENIKEVIHRTNGRNKLSPEVVEKIRDLLA